MSDVIGAYVTALEWHNIKYTTTWPSPHTRTHTRRPLTFHLDIAGAPVSRLDSVLVLVADAHVGQGRAHGVSGAVAVGGVVHVVHGRSQVRLQGGLGGRAGGGVGPTRKHASVT